MRSRPLLKRPRPRATWCDPKGAVAGPKSENARPQPLRTGNSRGGCGVQSRLLSLHNKAFDAQFSAKGRHNPPNPRGCPENKVPIHTRRPCAQRPSVNASYANYQRGGQGRRTYASNSPAGSGSRSPLCSLKPPPLWVVLDPLE